MPFCLLSGDQCQSTLGGRGGTYSNGVARYAKYLELRLFLVIGVVSGIDTDILSLRCDPSVAAVIGLNQTASGLAAEAAASKAIRDRPKRKTSFKSIRTTEVYR